MDELLTMRSIGIVMLYEPLRKVDIMHLRLESGTMDYRGYSETQPMEIRSISVDQRVVPLWEQDDVAVATIMVQIRIYQVYQKIILRPLNDMDSILLSLSTTTAIVMPTSEMRIVMEVEVSSEMMMTGLSEMHHLYLSDLSQNSISSINLPKQEHISDGIYLKIPTHQYDSIVLYRLL